MYNSRVFVAYNNNTILGIFDNQEILNYTLDGCIQKKFIEIKSIRIDTYMINSLFQHNIDNYYTSGYYNNFYMDYSGNRLDHYNNRIDPSNNRLDPSNNRLDPSNNRLNLSNNIIDASNNIIDISNNKELNEDKNRDLLMIELEKRKIQKQIDKKQQELEKSDAFLKMKQDNIDVVHQLNELKMKQKKIEEDKKSFNYDVELFKNLNKEKIKNPNFKIPELFEKKYNIFTKLEESNKLKFEDFKLEWDIIKPKNNYNLFTATTYEESFNKNKEESKSIEIELEI